MLDTPRHQLGRSGPTVSRIGLGTVQLGMDYGLSARVATEEAIELIRFALAQQINYFDTAPDYGESETVLGQALSGVARDSFVIATKCSPTKHQPLAQQLQHSLDTLQLERVDLLQVHSLALETCRSARFWSELEALASCAGCDHLGASTYDPEVVRLILAEHGDLLQAIQLPFSLFDRRFEGLLPQLQQSGIGVVARSVFLKGILFEPPDALPAGLEQLAGPLNELGSLGSELGCSVAELALGYSLCQPTITTTLVGVLNRQMLAENIRVLGTLDRIELTRTRLDGMGIDNPQLIDPRNWSLR